MLKISYKSQTDP